MGTKVSVKVKLGAAVVYKKNFDLCKELEKIGGKCPISSGKPKIVKTFTIPKAVPRVSLYHNSHYKLMGSSIKS